MSEWSFVQSIRTAGIQDVVVCFPRQLLRLSLQFANYYIVTKQTMEQHDNIGPMGEIGPSNASPLQMQRRTRTYPECNDESSAALNFRQKLRRYSTNVLMKAVNTPHQNNLREGLPNKTH